MRSELMAEQRRKFDQDFRDGAVRIVLETGRPIAEGGRGLRGPPGGVGGCVKQGRGGGVGGRGGVVGSGREELVRLRRDVSELRMQRDVLKRSVVLWVDEAM